MALTWYMTGGDGFESAESLERHFVARGASAVNVGGSQRGTNTIATGGGGVRRPIFPSSATGGMITRVKLPLTFNYVIMRCHAAGSTVHVDVRVDTDGTLRLTRNGTNLDTTSSGFITASNWYLIEMEWVIGNAPDGEARVWVDNVLELEATSVDTQNGTYGLVDSVNWGGSTNDPGEHYDLGIKDALGKIANSGWRVEARPMDQNGFHQDHTPSAGTNVDNIDDATDPDLATYNSSSTPGDKDSFVPAPLIKRDNETILGVQLIHFGLKNDSGSRDRNLFLRSGTTDGAPDYEYESFGGLGQLDQQLKTGFWTNDPATASPIASGDAINAMQPGYETV